MGDARTQRHVFGPVPSRRLGQSLGVDPIPFKTCNYNCVYCQLGRTRPLQVERRDYFAPDEILAQVERVLDDPSGRIDYVTFVGDGEPLLCASLGWLLRRIKARWPAYPVAVITNGSLLHRTDVREDLAVADLVMPTLDAADQPTFRRVNRPPGDVALEPIIDGMAALRRSMAGELWVEVMLVRGLNDDLETLQRLRAALARIAPDQVHINVAARPPAEPWVRIPAADALQRARRILGEVATVVSPDPGELVIDGAAGDDPAAAVEAIVRRHPMSEARLIDSLSRIFGVERSRAVLEQLEREGRLRRHRYQGEVFCSPGAGRFGTSRDG